MNAESRSNIHKTQSNKSTSYKRAHRAHRPVLVTQPENPSIDEQTTGADEEAEAAVQVTVEEQSTRSEETGRKRRPSFFSSVDRAEKTSDQPATDPMTARLARALRGKSTEAPQEKEVVKEKKVTSSGRTGTAAPTRPRSGFKTKHLMGMVAYLLIADVLGIYIQNFMQANNLDGIVFTTSFFQAKRSTLVFLALLVIILIVMARLDLIPRSLGAGLTDSARNKSASGSQSKSKTPTFETRETPPTIKQGVKGSNDDLYREYRENQRYFQKRDRKR